MASRGKKIQPRLIITLSDDDFNEISLDQWAATQPTPPPAATSAEGPIKDKDNKTKVSHRKILACRRAPGATSTTEIATREQIAIDLKMSPGHVSGAHASLIQAQSQNAADINEITANIAETVANSESRAKRMFNKAHQKWNAGLKHRSPR